MIGTQMEIGPDGRVAEASVRRRDDGSYHSRVFTDRPPYADFPAPRKFLAMSLFEGG